MNGRENRIFVFTVKSISLSSWTDTAPTPPFVCTACYEQELLEQGVGYTRGTTPLGGAALRKVLKLKVPFFCLTLLKEVDITLRSKAAVSIHELREMDFMVSTKILFFFSYAAYTR